MTIRDARFADVLEIADLLYQRSKGKTTEHLCRSRVQQAVKRARVSRKIFCRALVADADGKIRGFLYAEERNLFDLCPDIRVVEVPFLVSRHGAAIKMLRHLRSSTSKRILVQGVAFLGRQRAFARLLRPLDPETFAVVYQV